jgi:hypothetical protein
MDQLKDLPPSERYPLPLDGLLPAACSMAVVCITLFLLLFFA